MRYKDPSGHESGSFQQYGNLTSLYLEKPATTQAEGKAGVVNLINDCYFANETLGNAGRADSNLKQALTNMVISSFNDELKSVIKSNGQKKFDVKAVLDVINKRLDRNTALAYPDPNRKPMIGSMTPSGPNAFKYYEANIVTGKPECTEPMGTNYTKAFVKELVSSLSNTKDNSLEKVIGKYSDYDFATGFGKSTEKSDISQNQSLILKQLRNAKANYEALDDRKADRKWISNYINEVTSRTDKFLMQFEPKNNIVEMKIFTGN